MYSSGADIRFHRDGKGIPRPIKQQSHEKSRPVQGIGPGWFMRSHVQFPPDAPSEIYLFSWQTRSPEFIARGRLPNARVTMHHQTLIYAVSRELNELRKPASDNPEILRFFRYMKAAKDGQDGEECTVYKGCPALNTNQPSPALLTTFNEINKLVQARKLH